MVDSLKFGTNLLEKLKLEDGSGIRDFTRLVSSDSEELLEMVGSKICKKKEDSGGTVSEISVYDTSTL